MPADTPETNPFLELPHDGVIPFEKLTPEHIVKAAGKLSIELEYFLEKYGHILREEFDDKGR